MKYFTHAWLFLVLFGCASKNPTQVGYFKDSNVSGLKYRSASFEGTTNTLGEFEFKKGETISFYLGQLLMGQVEGETVVTPVQLVADGSSSDTEVLNRVRLLMLLDKDEEPNNGIEISEEVIVLAENWGSINLNANDFEGEIQSIEDDLQELGFEDRQLVSPETARSHLDATIRCANSGAYKGEYSSSDDHGAFGMLVDAQSGLVSSLSYSEVDESYGYYQGESSVTLDAQSSFTSHDQNRNVFIEGNLKPNTVNGDWFLSGERQGSFDGKRIGGLFDAKYRFTGLYELTNRQGYGLFSFDVDSDDQIQGVAYNVASDELFKVTGALSGSELQATAEDGTEIMGTMDKGTGMLQGNLSNSSVNFTGTFSGNGCKLN